MRHASLQANSMAGGKRALTRQRARGTGAALNPSAHMTARSQLLSKTIEDVAAADSRAVMTGAVANEAIREGSFSGSSSGASEGATSPSWTGGPPATMMATMSRWWGSSSDLPSVPSLESVIDFGAPVAERAVACKGPDATMSQLRREPRASVLERPERRDQGPSDGDQLDSLLSELLTLRSAQARLLAQPSVLKGACSLLPPCSTSSSSRLSSPAPLRRGSFAEAVRQ